MNPSCHHHPSLRSLILAGIAVTLVSAAVHGGTVLYVDDDALPAGDGLSWGTAYQSPQYALAAAGASGGAVNEIRVAQGVYTPVPDGVSSCCTPHVGSGCDDAGCEALVCAAVALCCVLDWDAACAAAAEDLCGGLCPVARAATFQLLDGVALRGGYAGIGAPDPDARDIALYETILSGDLAGNDGPGDFENNEENSYNVVMASGTGLTAVLDGLTITAGNADGLETDPLNWRRGAGIWNLTGSPTVTDCLITANSAVLGGGMYNRISSTPEILNCLFTENLATEGGGMFNFQSSPTITDCDFVGNEAEWGAGMDNLNDCHPVITRCTFVGNSGGCCGNGVGMQNAIGSNPTVTDCLFQGNLGNPMDSEGGGMRNILDCIPIVTNCTFSGNVAWEGAGMQNLQNSAPIVVNCKFLDNVATWGAAMENAQDNSDPLLVNCMIDGNTASSGGGGVLTLIDCVAELVNCTIVNNTTGGIGTALFGAIRRSRFWPMTARLLVSATATSRAATAGREISMPIRCSSIPVTMTTSCPPARRASMPPTIWHYLQASRRISTATRGSGKMPAPQTPAWAIRPSSTWAPASSSSAAVTSAATVASASATFCCCWPTGGRAPTATTARAISTATARSASPIP
jgi:hypothetical protein